MYMSAHSTLQPPPEMIKQIKKQSSVRHSPAKRRVGGIGVYQIVQCGTAGHNVRSKPNMRGTPVGRLGKNNFIDTIEEVS